MVTNGFGIKGWTTLIFYDFDSATFQIFIPFNSQMCDELGERDEEYSGKSSRTSIWSFVIIITFSYLIHLSSTAVLTVFYFCCCLKEGVNIL